MKKRVYLFILALFILISNVKAQEFNLSAGESWLLKELKVSNYNKPITELSFALLALEKYDIQDGISYLESKKTADNWNSNIKDTSFAILALNNFNKDVSKSIEWVLKQQKTALTSGSWLIQVNSNTNGQFKVRYNNGNNEKTFTLFDNKITECNDYFINVKNCLGSTIKQYDEFEIDCSNIGCNKISLIYEESNNFYIFQENDGSGTLRMENSCLPSTSGSSACDYESSLYATWILNSLNKDSELYTKNYLKKNVDKNTNIKRIIHNSLLYAITNNDNYLEFLKETQNNLSGSFDSNIYSTSIAILSLKSNSIAERAKDWIKTQQIKNPSAKEYGSWNQGNFLDTSAALYALAGSSTKPTFKSSYCGDKILDGDEDCDATYDSDGKLIDGDDIKCPGKCSTDCECKTTANECEANNNLCCNECKTESDHYSQYDNSCSRTQVCCSLCAPPTECTTDAECNTNEECINNECVALSSCNNDGFCDNNEDCDCDDCDTDPSCQGSQCTTDDDCAEGEKCNIDTSTCEKKSGFPWGYLIAFLIVVFLLMAGYVFYKKYKRPSKKPPTKPSFEEFTKTQPYKPYTPSQPKYMPPKSYVPPLKKSNSKDEEMEKKLDESIKKAKDLLGKK